MRWQVFLVLLLSVGALLLGAHLSQREALAATNYAVRWHAGNQKSGKYCFGIAGWHGNDVNGFADTMADDNGADGCSSSTSQNIYVRIQGWTYLSGSQDLLGALLNETLGQGGSDESGCGAFFAKLYQWNGTAWKEVGRNRYYHAGNLPPVGQVTYITVYMGYWSWARTTYQFGKTIIDCGSTTHHVHQGVRKQADWNMGVLQNPCTDYICNGGLSPQTAYSLWNTDYYLVKFDWDSPPP